MRYIAAMNLFSRFGDSKNIPLNALAVHILGNASEYLWYISVDREQA